MRRTVASANGAPAICRLSGIPSDENPLQTLSAGAPVMLNGAIIRRPFGEKKGGLAMSSIGGAGVRAQPGTPAATPALAPGWARANARAPPQARTEAGPATDRPRE